MPLSSTQMDCKAEKARLAELSKDEALNERIWRTCGSKGLSDSKTTLNDLLYAWKGVPVPLIAAMRTPRFVSFRCIDPFLTCQAAKRRAHCSLKTAAIVCHQHAGWHNPGTAQWSVWDWTSRSSLQQPLLRREGQREPDHANHFQAGAQAADAGK